MHCNNHNPHCSMSRRRMCRRRMSRRRMSRSQIRSNGRRRMQLMWSTATWEEKGPMALTRADSEQTDSPGDSHRARRAATHLVRHRHPPWAGSFVGLPLRLQEPAAELHRQEMAGGEGEEEFGEGNAIEEWRGGRRPNGTDRPMAVGGLWKTQGYRRKYIHRDTCVGAPHCGL